MKKILNGRYSPRGSISKLMLKMKLLTLFLMIGLTASSANTYSQNTKLSMTLNRVTVKEVIQHIEQNSEFIFLYNERSLDLDRLVNFSVKEESIDLVLEQLLGNTGNSWRVYDRQIVILEEDATDQPASQIPATRETINEIQPQTRDLSGVVRDERNMPLPGVSIIVKGTTIGTITNMDGTFNLSAPLNSETLVFSFIGMRAQEIAIGQQTNFTIVLVEETFGVDEVVVVGYGVQRKANLTGAVDQITSESFEGRSMPNITQGLKGVVPNLNIRLADGKPTQSPSFNIRGTTSIGQGVVHWY